MLQQVWCSAAQLLRFRGDAAVAATSTAGTAALRQTRRSLHVSELQQDEETTLAEYAERRQRFLEHLPPHSIALLPAADEFTYSHDILTPHRQDSLWYHLFGLHTPLRRQLEPPTSSVSTDVRATLAVLARFADNSTYTLLCVPPATSSPATVVWAADTAPLDVYEAALRVPSPTGCHPRKATAAVMSNDVSVVCETLRCLITQMALQQLERWTTAATGAKQGATDASPQGLTIEQRLARDRGDVLRLMPQFFVNYPSQLRWDGRRYRLPSGLFTPPHQEPRQKKREGVAVPKPSGKPAQLFSHPLEALFHALDSTAFIVQLPRLFFDGTAQPPWDSVVYRYKTASAYTPGLVSADVSRAPERRALPTMEATAAPTAGQTTVGIAASSKHESGSQKFTSRGEVRLPIRSADTHAWSYRQLKSPSQVRQHLRSARATEHAFVSLMRSAATAASEHDLFCAFQRSVCDASAHFGPAARVRPAYIPVIASGERGTDIHYTDNCATAVAGRDVVRVDAGVEVDNVPTDCTRTFPIGAAQFPSPLLAQLYDGLVQLQRTLLRSLAAGVAVRDVATCHLDGTRALLCALGVDVRRGEPSPTPLAETSGQETSSAQELQLPLSLVRSCFCAHSFGHLFGLDIHEEWGTVAPSSSSERSGPATARVSSSAPHILRGGMMHTVEPGIYMPSLARAALFGLTPAHLPVEFHSGVGVQVEDDVLILPPSAHTDAPPSHATTTTTTAAAASDLWGRGVYLQHALAAFGRYYHDAHRDGAATTTSMLSLRAPSTAVMLCQRQLQALLQRRCSSGRVASVLQPHEQNVVSFLFAQRLAIDGYESAAAAVAEDVAAAQRLTFTASPAYGSASLPVPEVSCTAWYPFDIVVLTATVPKDRQCVESLLQEPN